MDLDEFERQPLQLIKWPRARNYDLDRAERMLRRVKFCKILVLRCQVWFRIEMYNFVV